MIAPHPVKIVGVVADRAALQKATRLRRLPDFFELRLDTLRDCLPETERALPRLRAPVILTARHPTEGGRGALSAAARRALLERFLEQAAFIDLELRSLHAMPSLIAAARRRQIGLILSSHDLQDTPSVAVMRGQLKSAIDQGADIFKIATRTDRAAQLGRLLSFFEESAGSFPIAAMGIGKLGGKSRRRLLRLGSALLYAAVGQANAPGQPTLGQLRRNQDAYII